MGVQCDKPKERKNAKVGHAKGRRNYKFLLADCVSVKSPLPPQLKVQTNSQLNPVRVLAASRSSTGKKPIKFSFKVLTEWGEEARVLREMRIFRLCCSQTQHMSHLHSFPLHMRISDISGTSPRHGESDHIKIWVRERVIFIPIKNQTHFSLECT